MDLARSIQDITEEVMLKMTAFAHRETGMRDLCLAGGVALNCVGNGRMLREGPFEQIWIQPAAGDAGGALGVALSIWHRHLDKPRAEPGSGGHLGAPVDERRRRTVPTLRRRHERIVLGPEVHRRRDRVRDHRAAGYVARRVDADVRRRRSRGAARRRRRSSA